MPTLYQTCAIITNGEVNIVVPQGSLSKYEKLNFYGNCKLFEMKFPLSELEEKPCIRSFDSFKEESRL